MSALVSVLNVSLFACACLSFQPIYPAVAAAMASAVPGAAPDADTATIAILNAKATANANATTWTIPKINDSDFPESINLDDIPINLSEPETTSQTTTSTTSSKDVINIPGSNSLEFPIRPSFNAWDNRLKFGTFRLNFTGGDLISALQSQSQRIQSQSSSLDNDPSQPQLFPVLRLRIYHYAIVYLDKYANYSMNINLKDPNLFPRVLCQRSGAETNCDVILVPPKGYGIMITIQSLDLALKPNNDDGTRIKFADLPEDRSSQCRDYLQFKDSSARFGFGREAPKKICGYHSKWGAIDRLTGSNFFFAKAGSNVTVSFHREPRDNPLYSYGIDKNRQSDSYSSFDGQLLVTTHKISPSQNQEAAATSTGTKDLYTNYSYGYDSTDSITSPYHLAWWVILIIIVILLNFFALICKRMRELDARQQLPRRSDRRQSRSRRVGGTSLRDSFIMPSQLLQRFTEQGGTRAPSAGGRRGERTIHTILGLHSASRPGPLISEPPPVYPGGPPAFNDPYLPSYEALFGEKENKLRSAPAPGSPSTSISSAQSQNTDDVAGAPPVVIVVQPETLGATAVGEAAPSATPNTNTSTDNMNTHTHTGSNTNNDRY